MSKNRLVITILAIFLLIGTTSLAIGAIPDQKKVTTGTLTHMGTLTPADQIPTGDFPQTTVLNVGVGPFGATSDTVSAAKLILKLNNGQTRVVQAQISPVEETNSYTTLNSAVLPKQKVDVVISQDGLITSVQYDFT